MIWGQTIAIKPLWRIDAMAVFPNDVKDARISAVDGKAIVNGSIVFGHRRPAIIQVGITSYTLGERAA